MTQAKAVISYLHCNKEGLHEDERLNIVCLETGCLENIACCCACIDADHKGHMYKLSKEDRSPSNSLLMKLANIQHSTNTKK